MKLNLRNIFYIIEQTAAQAGRMAAQGPVRPQVGNQESRVPGRTDEPVQ